jgi:hypothetical protein
MGRRKKGMQRQRRVFYLFAGDEAAPAVLHWDPLTPNRALDPGACCSAKGDRHVRVFR